MFRRTFIITLLALAGVAVAAPGAAHAKLKVLATVPDLAAIAREVGGGHAEVTALVLPTQDPHFVDSKPSMALKAMKADLLLAVGLDLEIGWLPTLQTGARNAKIQTGARGYLDCSTLVTPLEVPKGKVDRSQGDIHPGGNPHYLYDPRRAALVAAGVAERMAELDPAHADDYRKNARAFQERLAKKQAEWQKQLAPLRAAPVIVYHRSWAYLADWLGFEIVAELEPKPGIPPTSKHVAKVLAIGRKRGVKLILQESYYPSGSSELLAKKLPARLLELPGGSDFAGGEGYIEHMDHVVGAIVTAMEHHQ